MVLLQSDDFLAEAVLYAGTLHVLPFPRNNGKHGMLLRCHPQPLAQAPSGSMPCAGNLYEPLLAIEGIRGIADLLAGGVLWV